MRRIILACALAAILAIPAKALDGTRAPANVLPAIKAPPQELVQAPMPAQAQSLREQVVGAWAVVSCNLNNPAIKLSCGTDPNGILINDASGRYAWVIALRGRPKGSESANAMPAEELGALARGLTANFGTWSVNEADKTYTIHIEGALFPNVEGAEVKATVSVSGEELRIGGANGQTVYRRVK